MNADTPQRTNSKPEFRIRLNNQYVPNIRVQKARDGGYDLAVRFDIDVQHEDATIEELDLGWFVAENRPDLVLQYRDESSWALLPTEIKRASLDKGWNTCAPQELIGILWNTGILQ